MAICGSLRGFALDERRPRLAHNGAVLWYILRTRACYSPVTVTVIFRMLESNMARFLRPSIRSFVTSQLRMSSDQVIISWKRFRCLRWIHFYWCVLAFSFKCKKLYDVCIIVWNWFHMVPVSPNNCAGELNCFFVFTVALCCHKKFLVCSRCFSKQGSLFCPFSFRLN